MPRFIRFLILVSLPLLAGSCSFLGFGKEAPAPPPQKATPSVPTSTISVEELKTKKTRGTSVEMVWEIPADPVEGYTIRYGFAQDSLSSEVKVKAADLEKYEDPVHGYVYRYYLDGIPPARNVFINISAFNAGQESPPSRVYTVPAEKKGSDSEGKD